MGFCPNLLVYENSVEKHWGCFRLLVVGCCALTLTTQAMASRKTTPNTVPSIAGISDAIPRDK